MKYLAIFAHPDDMEVRMGGTTLKLTAAGHEVTFVSLTNGNAGHHAMAPAALATRRAAEAQAAAAALGLAEYRILDTPDGALEPSLAQRQTVLRLIRQVAPDVIFTFRPGDYHPDHRAAAQLVLDAAYLLAVPLICPDAPIPARRPVVLCTWDTFTWPCPFRADAAVAIDAVAAAKMRVLACHASQFFEWLAYDRQSLADVPGDPAARLEWLAATWLPRDREQAAAARDLLVARYPDTPVTHAETFAVSEYGRRPDPGELDALLPR